MNRLTAFLIDEQQARRKGGLYHKTQVQLAYNSDRIGGSKLTAPYSSLRMCTKPGPSISTQSCSRAEDLIIPRMLKESKGVPSPY